MKSSAAIVSFVLLGAAVGSQAFKTAPGEHAAPPRLPDGVDTRREQPSGKDATRGPETPLVEFYRLRSSAEPDEARDSLRAVIATVPDPIDAHLADEFDQVLNAIQQAVGRQGYVLDRHWIPWNERAGAHGASAPDTGAEPPHQPGALLFRHLNYPCRDGAAGGCQPSDLLLVLLVGEQPTSGLDKVAFMNALEVIRAQSARHHMPLPDPQPILAPFYSGSAGSLRAALAGALREEPRHWRRFDIVSGSATSDTLHDKLCLCDKADAGFTCAGGRECTAATFDNHFVVDDHTSSYLFLRYLKDALGGTPDNTCILYEESTSYGALFKETVAKPDGGTAEDASYTPACLIPFSLHISQMRMAYERQEALKGGASPAMPPTTVRRTLELHLDDTGESNESVRESSPLTHYSDELVLRSMLERFARNKIQYVGIVATDKRDKIFLAKQVHKYCPNVRLFTFENDIIYSHPDLDSDLGGMFVVSAYPLTSSVDTLMVANPYQPSFGSAAGTGIFEAMNFLLGDKTGPSRMYPIGTSALPLWITLVSNGQTWPIRFEPGTRRDRPAKTNDSAPPVTSLQPRPLRLWLPNVVLIAVVSGAFFLRLAALVSPRGLRKRHALLRVLLDPPSLRRSPWTRLLHLTALTLYGYALAFAVIPSHVIKMGAFFPEPRLRWTAGAALVLYPLMAIILGIHDFGIARVQYRRLSRLKLSRSALATKQWLFALGRGASWAVAVALLGAPPLAVSLLYFPAAAFKLDHALGPTDFALNYERAVTLLGGVSPITPMILVGAILPLFAACQQRLGEVSARKPSDSSFAGVTGLPLNFPSLRRLSRIHWANVAVLVLAAVPVFYHATIYRVSVEGWQWDRVYVLLFLSGGVLGALAFWTFLDAWRSMASLLKRLASDPLVPAFDRIPEKFSRSFWTQLYSRSYDTRELAVSIHQWRALQNQFRQRRVQIQAQLSTLGLDTTELQALEARMEPRALEGVEELLRQRKAAPLSRRLSEVSKVLAPVLRALWTARPLIATLDSLERVIKDAGVKDAAELARTNTLILHEQSLDADALWFRLAEDFVAVRVVTYLNTVAVLIRHLLVFAMLSVTLLLISLSSYPFQAKQLLMIFPWAMLLGFIVVALGVFMQMERDEVLSRISGTEPGKLTLNPEFISKVAVFVLMPLALLFAVAFPGVGSVLMEWVNSLLHVVK